MFIHEVEHIVSLSKKSIRYYEENGLLTPTRNYNNDYRIYSDEDVKKLKIIKFLRELDVPIKDLQALNDGRLTLQDCMKERIKKIHEQKKKYDQVEKMCKEISISTEDFKTIDITKYFQEINTLNKEGFTMKKTHSNRAQKIRGAVISSIVFGSFFVFLIGIMTYFQITETENMPWIVYGFLMIILGLPLLGIVLNLISRIKEINGGEEDEASKY